MRPQSRAGGPPGATEQAKADPKRQRPGPARPGPQDGPGAGTRGGARSRATGEARRRQPEPGSDPWGANGGPPPRPSRTAPAATTAGRGRGSTAGRAKPDGGGRRAAERPEAPPGGADGAEHTAEAPARRTGRPHRGGPEGRPRHAARRARGPGAAPCQPG